MPFRLKNSSTQQTALDDYKDLLMDSAWIRGLFLLFLQDAN